MKRTVRRRTTTDRPRLRLSESDPHPSRRAAELSLAACGSRPLAAVVGALLLIGCLSCSDRVTGSLVDQVVRITDSNFIPGDLVLERGVIVEWQNASRERRTVTSGHGASDPAAGREFDVELAGYKAGEPFGGSYRRRFTQVDTVFYFSRLVPDNFVGNFAGKIIIR